MMPSRLFWKFFLAFCMASICLLVIGMALLSVLRNGPAQMLAVAQVQEIVADVIAADGPAAAEPVMLQQARRNGRMALYDAEGKFIAGVAGVALGSKTQTVLAPDGRRYQLAIAAPQSSLAPPLLVSGFVSVLFSAALAWYFSVPLAHLSAGFRAVSAGQLSTRLGARVGARRDEIADLAHEFDGMAAQLEQLWLAQQRLLHNISHELRSPLARLQVAVGLLRQSPDGRMDMVSRVEREADRLEGLLAEILTLARLKAGHALGHEEKIDLMDLVSAIIDDANFEAQTKACRVTFEGAAPFVTFAKGEVLYRAFENVIRNAVKYSPPGETVLVRAGIEHDRLVLEVIDKGPGVPTAAREEMFDAFKRFDGEARRLEGFGLGLAIAREAVLWHGGDIRAEDGPLSGGLKMVVTVPRRGAPLDTPWPPG